MPWFGRTSTTPAAKTSPDSGTPVSANLERLTLQIGQELLNQARQHRAGVFSARFWSDQLMNWAMKDPAFKVQMFRFVDAFPTLASSRHIHECLNDYLSQPGVTLPPGMALGLKAGGLAKGIMAKTISNRITAMAGNFIAGVDALSALPGFKKMWNRGVAFSVDLLGEACVSDSEAHVYQARYLELLDTLPEQVALWPAKELLETDNLGPIPRCNVSIKISSLAARTDPIDFDGSI
ncbi:MAG: hypothetical protein HQ581_26925, partial [Planctomycetes bacterium]|nr:hypothetical protein [Planctomycetota bacterium]